MHRERKPPANDEADAGSFPSAPLEYRDRAEGPLHREDAGRLELLEEVPDVRVQRVPAGAAVLRKEVQTRTETVELELRTETLVVRRVPISEGGAEPGAVEVDGRLLEPGEEARVVIYREEADVRKVPVVYERVAVEKREVAERESVPLELRRERLSVDVQGAAVVRDPSGTLERDPSPRS